MAESIYVGIDVSKATLDIATSDGQIWSCSNQEQDFKELIERLSRQTLGLIVLEASGGYEGAVVAHLHAAGLPVFVVNPKQVRAFAKALGRLAKSDRIDAQVLAQFAQKIQPELRPLKDEHTQVLDALLARRRQILAMLVAERQRLQIAAVNVRTDIREHIHFLVKRLKDTDRGLDELVRETPLWREREELFKPVKGVGTQLLLSLCAGLPELGQLSRKKIDRSGGCCSLQLRLRHLTRAAPLLGRTRRCALRLVHGGPERHALQSGDRGLLPAFAEGRQSKESRSYRLHAQTSHDPQRDGSRSQRLERATASDRLTINTVAHPRCRATSPRGEVVEAASPHPR